MDILRDFENALSLEGLRPSTVYHYVRDARRLCAHLNGTAVAEVTPAMLREYLMVFRRGRKAKTLREAQIALRRFFRWLVSEGLVPTDPTVGIRLASFRTAPQPTYAEAEVQRLLAACFTKTAIGIRDRALILVLYDTGVREGELISMGAVHFDRRSVQVTGKTGTRDVPLGRATVQALTSYTRRWGVNGGTLWWGERGPLTESGVLQAIRRLCREAGVEHKGVHGFRRAAAAQMKRLGMQDSDIMEILGWKSVVMLRRYTAAVAGELAQRAHDLYSPADNLKGLTRRRE
jgi:site-specific recombinase XerD